MPQTLFSQSPLSAGQTSAAFKLPTRNSDGTGSQTFVLYVGRDDGAIRSDDGTYDVNRSAVVTVLQDGNTLATVASDGPGFTTFSPNPLGGSTTIKNAGPGAVFNVTIEDGFRR